MIKIAEPSDLDLVVYLVTKFLEESPYQGRERDLEKITASVKYLLSSPKEDSIALLSLLDKRVTGIVSLSKTTLPFSNQVLVQEITWYIEPEFRKSRAALELFHAAEFWAKKIGAHCIQFSSLSNSPDTVDKFYTRQGYELTERAYLKWLVPPITLKD